MSKLLRLAAASYLIVFAGSVQAQGTGSTQAPKTVLELFTSQGCSSCPPADALLPNYIARKDVIGLTLPVDYWDYLGWRDTFGKAQFSARQRRYARRRGDNMVYTPQIVVNGMTHAVGSRPNEIDAAIAKSERALANRRLRLSITIDDGKLRVERMPAEAGGPLDRAIVWLALAQEAADVGIGRGENRGRTLSYHHVVRTLKNLGTWGEGSTTFEAGGMEMGGDITGCIVLVQDGEDGPIIGAEEIWLPG